MRILIKAAVAAGSLFAAAAAQAELPSAESAAITPVQPAEQPLAELELTSPLPELALPALADATVINVEAFLTDGEMVDHRGGQAIVIADQDMTAITAGNVLNGDYIAGNITLSDNALSSFNGVGNLLVNTGGLASIQSGINVTINIGE